MIETLVFSYTVTRKKHESSCLLRDRFWCISPEPLEVKKSYLHLFASLSKELSDEKKNFSNSVTKSTDICKSAVLPEKVSYWKKSRILKNSKTFFMDLRYRNWTYIQTIFLLKNRHATSSSQARCVCPIFVNLMFNSCH